MENGKVIVGSGLCFYEEESAWSGVKKTADNVRKDIELVTGYYPESWKMEEEGCKKIILILPSCMEQLDVVQCWKNWKKGGKYT